MDELVYFRALGRLELTRGSKPLDLVRRRKPLAVFAFLALSRNAFQSRDVVQATFWPESDQDRARHSLNETLSLLRKELGPNIVVNRGAGEIGIAAGGLWSDVVVFNEMLLAKEYAKALELYRGDLLPGFFIPGAPDFERWLDEERGRLRRAATDAACLRAELELEKGRRTQAGEWARRAAAMALGNEVVVRRSIQLLDLLGDRAGAIEAFESLSRQLRQQYGTQPAPETRRLILGILRREEPSAPEPFDPPRQTENQEIRALIPRASPAAAQTDHDPEPDRGRPEAAPIAVRHSSSRPVGSQLPSQLRRRLIAATILGAFAAAGIWIAQQVNNDERPASRAARRPAILVSPFQNLGTISDFEHLAPAITTALTEQLAQVDAIELIANETSVAAAWTDASANRLRSSEAPEAFVVRGNVLPTRNRIRVVISLIDAKSGAILHTTTVERPIEDVFHLIDEVAQDLGELLRAELGHEIRLRQWRAGTASTRAWELQKRAELERQRAKSLEADGAFAAAAEKLEEADSLLVMAQAEDSTWDAPTVWRARVASDAAWLSFLPPVSDTAQTRRWIEAGITHTDRALQQDSAHAVALELRGLLRYWSSMIAPPSEAEGVTALRQAETDLRRAVSVDPARARAWSLLSAILESRGDFSESHVASQHAYSADAYLEAREETLLRLAMTAYEIGNDSVAWRWCSAVDPQTPEGADCRLSLLAWSDVHSSLPPPGPWEILAPLSEGDPIVRSWRPLLMMLTATVLARRDLADSARAVITRARAADPHNHELDLLEAGARLRLGETDTAAALLRRFVTANPAHNRGVIASRRFTALRDLVHDLMIDETQ